MHGGLNRQKKGACIVYLDNAQLIPIIYGKKIFQKTFGGFKKSCTFAAFKPCGLFRVRISHKDFRILTA